MIGAPGRAVLAQSLARAYLRIMLVVVAGGVRVASYEPLLPWAMLTRTRRRVDRSLAAGLGRRLGVRLLGDLEQTGRLLQLLLEGVEEGGPVGLGHLDLAGTGLVADLEADHTVLGRQGGQGDLGGGHAPLAGAEGRHQIARLAHRESRQDVALRVGGAVGLQEAGDSDADVLGSVVVVVAHVLLVEQGEPGEDAADRGAELHGNLSVGVMVLGFGLGGLDHSLLSHFFI